MELIAVVIGEPDDEREKRQGGEKSGRKGEPQSSQCLAQRIGNERPGFIDIAIEGVELDPRILCLGLYFFEFLLGRKKPVEPHGNRTADNRPYGDADGNGDGLHQQIGRLEKRRRQIEKSHWVHLLPAMPP